MALASLSASRQFSYKRLWQVPQWLGIFCWGSCQLGVCMCCTSLVVWSFERGGCRKLEFIALERFFSNINIQQPAAD